MHCEGSAGQPTHEPERARSAAATSEAVAEQKGPWTCATATAQ